MKNKKLKYKKKKLLFLLIRLKIAEPYVEINNPKHFSLCVPIYWIRNWFLYTKYPSFLLIINKYSFILI